MGAGSLLKKAATMAALREPTEYELRHAVAQKNAMEMLGLPAGNTASQRAVAMGFPDPSDVAARSYHGGLHDIKNVDLSRSSPGGHAGQGFYTTPSPKDASMNYASITGPDTNGKIVSKLESAENAAGVPYSRTTRAASDGTLSPRRAEIVARNAVGADNLGVVYPVVVKRGKVAHAGDPKKSAKVGPAERYDEELDEYIPGEDSDKWAMAQNVMDGFGVETPARLQDSMLEGGDLGSLWKAIKKSNHEAYDDEGSMVSPGGLATEYVKAMGADTITHPTLFTNPQLNIGGEHTIALRPNHVRSIHAAFDPARAHESDILGAADPQLLKYLGGGAATAAAMPIITKRLRED
jgi:hypothetical protein